MDEFTIDRVGIDAAAGVRTREWGASLPAVLAFLRDAKNHLNDALVYIVSRTRSSGKVVFTLEWKEDDGDLSEGVLAILAANLALAGFVTTLESSQRSFVIYIHSSIETKRGDERRIQRNERPDSNDFYWVDSRFVYSQNRYVVSSGRFGGQIPPEIDK